MHALRCWDAEIYGCCNVKSFRTVTWGLRSTSEGNSPETRGVEVGLGRFGELKAFVEAEIPSLRSHVFDARFPLTNLCTLRGALRW